MDEYRKTGKFSRIHPAAYSSNDSSQFDVITLDETSPSPPHMQITDVKTLNTDLPNSSTDDDSTDKNIEDAISNDMELVEDAESNNPSPSTLNPDVTTLDQPTEKESTAPT